ncbi:MAG TPA: beta-phosphoglucomutase [Tenuifilaceae bacterium]|nr:beta-phosphoglucomutase [Bacteroidales bacterium]HNT40847.1 beta-phosphoglucomutase [Tenuifilaceae bacterium]HNY09435.1 beta-phosphoglucomutase [Tenuifilaceae bacterium]HOA09322.1 beta-phosphoglucomutase [Tenuifilaceae bacterium]HOC36052.1 beta-phosphoglucomutase [Tenuifilaceae bacterium]
MSSIKGCIFDLDGVVVDTAKYHYQAWKRLANELGFEFDESHNERLKGVSRMRSLEILLEVGGLSFPQEKMEQLAARKNEWYVEYISRMTPNEILPGSKELLEELRAKGIKLALGSASKNTPLIMDRIGLKDHFDAIIDGNIISIAKPAPDIFLAASKAIGVEPPCCIVFEDAEAGVEAAINAGMRVVGIGNPQVLKRANLVVPNLKNFTFQYLVNSLSEK